MTYYSYVTGDYLGWWGERGVYVLLGVRAICYHLVTRGAGYYRELYGGQSVSYGKDPRQPGLCLCVIRMTPLAPRATKWDHVYSRC